MVESWFYIKNDIKYWEWRHAYKKCLDNIIKLREPNKRLHKDSDKQIVDILKQCVHRCQLWILDMINPEEVN